MLADMTQGLLVIFQPQFLLFMMLGIALGLIFGLIPGLSGVSGIAILLPFAWGMDPALALAFLMAVHAVCYTGGSITSILLNIPGTGINAATLLDGFPMTQQGKAGRAIGSALMSSGLGGLFGGIVLALLIPAVRPIVLAFQSPERVFLILLGVTFIAVLGKGSMVKGLISGCLGVVLGCVGYQEATGFARFTFGMTNLWDGIGIVPMALGLFAIPEVINLLVRGGTILKAGISANPVGADLLQGVKDVFHHWWLFLRCSTLGTLVGIIPGIGGEVSIWVAYGHAKQTSKHPETFGTGNIEGVIAPESANNAKEGGSLVPTLAFGIPGSATMAVMLGAFLIVGLQPGPAFLEEHLDIAFTLVGSLIFANIIGAAICFPAATKLAKIAAVRGQVLAPLILVVLTVGIYCVRNNLFDVFLAFGLSVLGWVMRESDYNRAALFLGFVLGGLLERYLYISLAAFGPTFFLTPISLILIAITILSLFSEQIKVLFRRTRRLSSKKQNEL